MDDDHAEPMNVTSTSGSVVILGPARMEGAFTPDAAEESAMRLLMAAAEARQWVNPIPMRRNH